MNQRWLRIIGPFFGFCLFVGALLVLRHELRHYHYRDIIASFRALPAGQLALAGMIAAFNYFILSGVDVLALQYVRYSFPYRWIGPVSFTAYVLGHNLGFSVLSGGAARYRMYCAIGVAPLDIARIISFCLLTFVLGFTGIGGLALWGAPILFVEQFPLAPWVCFLLGAGFLFVPCGYLFLAWKGAQPFIIKDQEFTLPSLGLGANQVLLGFLDLLTASAVLYVLLPASIKLTFPQFAGVYLFSMLIGIISTVPGGFGVFETTLLLILPGVAHPTEVMGSLLAFRAIYYLIPLMLAIIWLVVYELLHRQTLLETTFRQVREGWLRFMPQLLAVAVFMGGIVLTFSGAAPPVHGRLAWLSRLAPLPVIEMSHFLASVAGAALLVLARGLQRRLDAAYYLCLGLLAFGAVASLLKGADYEEAIFLAFLFFILLPCRWHFFRKASLWGVRFTPGWVALIGIVVAASLGLGLFCYQHVEYAHELWWQFTLHGAAPRFMRAEVGIAVLLVLAGLFQLLKQAPTVQPSPTTEQLETVWPIILAAPHPCAHLALLGDKSLLISESRRSFLMFGGSGKSWIAFGDPVGPPDEAPELAWQFRELCDHYGQWTVFYQVRPEYLPIYLDLGLGLFKLGEEARIPLETFSLEGSARRNLRHTDHALQRAGCVFEVLPPEAMPAHWEELQQISSQWLEAKHASEKRFSLGCFQRDYLQRHPIAVVRKAGRIIAFANLLLTENRREFSPDLMRYAQDAPASVIEFLFLHLALWGKAGGYQWLSLGMAPLSGLEDHQLAPLWSKLGAFIYAHLDHYYNFQGLRAFKEKFNPEWEPRYLAAPQGLAIPSVLTDIVTLISGGLRGAVGKSRGV